MRSCLIVLVCCVAFTGAIAPAQDAAPAAEPVATPVRSLESKFDLREMSDALIAQYDKDPIGRIAGDMGKVEGMLGQFNTNDPTQPKQQDIIASLDEFIAMLEKRRKNAKSGSSANPSSPLPDSILAKGPGGQGNMKDPNASARLWGQLPPKQREQILQSQNEGFPPGYEAILSSYYKRLAQENVEGSSDSNAPATQPTPGR